jgi:hypothetical protein
MCPSKRTSLASARYSWLDCLFIREVDMPSSIDIGPVEEQVDAYASDGLDEIERNTIMCESTGMAFGLCHSGTSLCDDRPGPFQAMHGQDA